MFVDWSKDGLEICVNNKWNPSHILPVGKYDSAVGHRVDVKLGNLILAGAELLMTLECTFKSKLSKAAFAIELMIIMLSNVTKKATKVFNHCVMLFEVEQVDVNWTIMSADVHWIASSTIVFKITKKINRDV